MNINVNVTVTPSKEFIDLVSKIFGMGEVSGMAQSLSAMVDNAVEQIEEVKQEVADKPKRTRKPKEEVVEQWVAVTETSAVVNASEETAENNDAPTITLAQLQDLARKQTQGGKRDAVVALLEKYKAKRVSDVAIVDYASFYNELNAL